jgi:hypothetical protein
MRLQGDTWDEDAVVDAAISSGLAVLDGNGAVDALGRKFATEQEFRAEIIKRDGYYAEMREAALNALIYAPSDGKEPEKRKKKDEEDKKEK